MSIVSMLLFVDSAALCGGDDLGGWLRQGARSVLGGGIAAPVRVGRYVLALHQEGIGVERGAFAHRDPVMDEGDAPDAASGPDNGAVGFEGAVLEGMALDDAPGGEGGVAAHAGQAPLDDRAAVVEDPAADPHAKQPPDDALERRAVEHR